MTSSPADGNTATSPEFINKSLNELLASPTSMPDSGDNSDNADIPVLFASYLQQDKNANDEQPAMNASLINIFNLESDLAATRLVVEEHELEIIKLKKANSDLKSNLEQYKKTDSNQKSKIKKLIQENDNLSVTYPNLTELGNTQLKAIRITNQNWIDYGTNWIWLRQSLPVFKTMWNHMLKDFST